MVNDRQVLGDDLLRLPLLCIDVEVVTVKLAADRLKEAGGCANGPWGEKATKPSIESTSPAPAKEGVRTPSRSPGSAAAPGRVGGGPDRTSHPGRRSTDPGRTGGRPERPRGRSARGIFVKKSGSTISASRRDL